MVNVQCQTPLLNMDNQKPKFKSSLARDLSFYWEITSQIVISLFLFGLIGFFTDEYFKSQYVFTIIGFIVGLYVCFISVRKIITKWFNQN